MPTSFSYTDASGAELRISGVVVDTNQIISCTINTDADLKEIMHYGTYPFYDAVAKRIKTTGNFNYYKNQSGGNPILPTGTRIPFAVSQPDGYGMAGTALITKSSYDIDTNNDANEVKCDFFICGMPTWFSGATPPEGF